MPRRLECSLCGEAFTCQKGDGCWCGEVKAARGIAELSKVGAKDCVCPKCLGR